MSAASPKQENLLLNLFFNIAAPWAVLSLLSKPERLGPVWGLVIALAFPLGYGLYDYAKRRDDPLPCSASWRSESAETTRWRRNCGAPGFWRRALSRV